jgi:hypothetical protein
MPKEEENTAEWHGRNTNAEIKGSSHHEEIHVYMPGRSEGSARTERH